MRFERPSSSPRRVDLGDERRPDAQDPRAGPPGDGPPRRGRGGEVIDATGAGR